jgi:hypothetical protein
MFPVRISFLEFLLVMIIFSGNFRYFLDIYIPAGTRYPTVTGTSIIFYPRIQLRAGMGMANTCGYGRRRVFIIPDPNPTPLPSIQPGGTQGAWCGPVGRREPRAWPAHGGGR